MAGSIQLHLELQNSLGKTLKESKDTMKNFNSILEQSSKKFNNINSRVDKISDEYKLLVANQKKSLNLTNKFSKAMDNLWKEAKMAATPITALFTASNIINVTKEVFRYNKELTHLSYRMGDAGKNAKFLQKEVYQLTFQTGASTKETLEMIKSLKGYRVADKDVHKMAKTMIFFTQVTGVSADATKRLAGELMLSGKMSAKSASDIMGSMAKIQKVVGLTSQDMEALTEGIIQSTRTLQQMGKSASDIENFNKGLTKLTAGFATVGLSAKDATSLVDDLLNPDKIEENALLYSKLGISMSDAISGNIDPGELTAKLKGLGQQLKGMNNIAANQLAKSMGKSLGELRQMAGIDLSKTNKAMLGSKDGTKELEKQKNAMMTVSDKLEQGFNKIKGGIEYGMAKIFFGIDKLKKFFKPALIIGMSLLVLKGISMMRKKLLSVGTNFGKSIEDGVVGGIEMADKKTNILARKMKELGGGFLTNRETRVKGSTGFAKTNEKADYFEALAGSNITNGMKKMSINTAKMLRDLSYMSKPITLREQATKNINKYIADQLFMVREEKVKTQQLYETQKDSLDIQLSMNKARIQELAKVKRNGEQNWEYNKLLKQNDKIIKEMTAIENKKEASLANQEKLKRRIVKNLGKEELAELYKDAELRKEMAQNRLKELAENKKNLKIEKDFVEQAIKSLEVKKKNGNLSVEEWRELKKLKKDQTEYNDLLAENSREWERQINKAKEAKKLVREIENTTGKSGVDIKVEGGATQKSFLGKTGDFFSSKLKKASTDIAVGFTKFKESTKVFVENVKTRLSPKSLAAGIGKGLSSTVKNISKAGKAMAKAGLAFIGMKILMEVLKPVIEKLKPIFIHLINKLMPAFFKVLKALFPIFAVIVNTLLPPLLKILGYLLEGIGNLSKSLMTLPIKLKYAFKIGWSAERKKQAEQADIANMAKNNSVYKVFDSLSSSGKDIIKTASGLGQVIDPHALDNTNFTPLKTSTTSTKEATSYAATLRASSNGIAVESAAKTPEQNAKNTAVNTASTAESTKKVEENTAVIAKQLEDQKKINSSLVDAINKLSNKIDGLKPSGIMGL